MAAKFVLASCALAVVLQMALSQSLAVNSGIGSLGTTVGSSGFGSSFGSILNSANTVVASPVSSASSFGSNFGSILNSGNTVVASPLSNSASTVTGLTGLNIVAGGPLTVTSISPIGPSGLAVASENVIEGLLTVNGQLPFLSAVAFEGALPTSGSGVATCGCGNGQVAITSQGLAGGVSY